MQLNLVNKSIPKGYIVDMARTNIRQIEAFNAVMKGGSISKAAETLFVSQPAVSKMIRAFEDACGFKLFVRASSRIRPTAEARRLFLETEKLQAGVARVENTAKAIRGLERGDLAVVAFPALSFRLLPRAAARFMRRHKDVSLQLLTRTSPSIAASMLTGEADFGISLLASQDPGISCRPFSACSLVCALPPDHRLVGQDCVDLADLAGDRLITLGRADTSHQMILGALSEAGVTLDFGVEAQMADAACALVSEGLGVALVPSLITPGWPSDKVVFRRTTPGIRMKIWLYTSAFEPVQQLALMLMDNLRDGIDEIERGFGQQPDR